MITTNELAQLRANADDWLPDTCTIQTATESVDATGGGSIAWANTYTSVACRLAPLTGQEAVRNYALEGQSTWRLSVKYDQALTVENRVVFDSDTYEVKYVEDDHSNRTLRRAILVRVD